jgi:hypothetical protein
MQFFQGKLSNANTRAKLIDILLQYDETFNKNERE